MSARNNDIIGHNFTTGIDIVGGHWINKYGEKERSQNNLITGEITNNKIYFDPSHESDSYRAGISIIGGGDLSEANTVDLLISNSEISGHEEGIKVSGGFLEEEEETAKNNSVNVEIRDNLVEKIRNFGIDILGGEGSGTVVGNTVKADVIANIVHGISCKDGIAGNRAECTLSPEIPIRVVVKHRQHLCERQTGYSCSN